MDLNNVSTVPKKNQKYRQYCDGFDDYIYELAQLVDNFIINEDNKEYYIRMYTDKIRDLGETDERREYYKDLFNTLQQRKENEEPLKKEVEVKIHEN